MVPTPQMASSPGVLFSFSHFTFLLSFLLGENAKQATARYFYETNSMDECKRTCEINMTAVEQLPAGPERADLTETILSHQAQMMESLGYPEEGVRLNKDGYAIRMAEVPLKRKLLCYTGANLGSCYSSAGNHAAGVEWHNKAIEWWGDMPTSLRTS
jgi:hypothetical protein